MTPQKGWNDFAEERTNVFCEILGYTIGEDRSLGVIEQAVWSNLWREEARKLYEENKMLREQLANK